MTPLAAPLRLPSGLTLPNRIVKASMSEGLASRDGTSSERLVRLYTRWAQGGAGALLSGNVMVDARYLERPGNLVVEGDGGSPLADLASAMKSSGGAAIAQISHPGRQTNRFVSTEPLAPSDGPAVNMLMSFAPPRAMTAGEIEDAIRRFADTARALDHAGFDGVELHAAHGYLINQFLSPLTNRREDAWGGDAERRARFLLEVLTATRAATRSGFTVGVKLNSADFQRGGFDEGAAIDVVRRLDRAGIDFLEISGGNYESPALFGAGVKASTRAREAYFLEFAEALRGVTKTPLLVTGGFRSGSAMANAIKSGACDLIGLARPLALFPDLPRELTTREDARATLPPLRAPKAVSALADAAFFAEQIRRMGNGLEPSSEVGLFSTISRYVVGDIVAAARLPKARSAQAHPLSEARS